jgi:hypothetical protein
MSLIGLAVFIAIAGVLLWALPRLPIDPTLAKIVWVLVIVVVAIAVILFIAGMFGHSTNIRLSLNV